MIHLPDHAGRRAWHRPLGAIVALTCSALLSVATPVAAADAAPRPVDQVDAPSLSVAGQDFEVAPDGAFRVFLDIAGAPADSDVAVQIYDRITSDSELEASTTEDPENLLATFDLLPLSAQDVATQPAFFAINLYRPGEGRPAGVAPGWAWQLDEPGVYPIQIRLRDPNRRDLSTIVTYLVRQPDGADQIVDATSVALVAEVGTPPPTEPSAPDPLDSDFLEALDEFSTILGDHPDVPVSFDVSPDTATRLNGDPGSVDTLSRLRTEITRPGRELLAAPYVAIDPASLVGADLTDEIIRQRDYGARALGVALGFGPDSVQPTDATWVLDDRVDAPTVAVLDELGIANLVLPSGSVESAGTGPFLLQTPNGKASILALTSTIPDDEPADPVLAAYQLLGQASARAAIDPGGASAIRLDPGSTDPIVLASILGQLSAPSTYLKATTVTNALFGAGPPTQPVSPTAPVDTQRASRGGYASLVKRTHQLLSSYASMLTNRPDLLETYERPLARSASPALTMDQRTRLLSGTRSDLRTQLEAISTPETDRVTLGTREAQFPLPISSTLDVPVTVLVTLEARDRLSLPRSSFEVTVNEGRTVVPIPVNARATGDTPLLITVTTPDGSEVLSQSKYTVRSTAVSGVGLILTIGAGGFLALWWGRHWRRSRRDRSLRPTARHQRSGGRPPDLIDEELFVPDAIDVTNPADVTPSTPHKSNPR